VIQNVFVSIFFAPKAKIQVLKFGGKISLKVDSNLSLLLEYGCESLIDDKIVKVTVFSKATRNSHLARIVKTTRN